MNEEVPESGGPPIFHGAFYYILIWDWQARDKKAVISPWNQLEGVHAAANSQVRGI